MIPSRLPRQVVEVYRDIVSIHSGRSARRFKSDTASCSFDWINIAVEIQIKFSQRPVQPHALAVSDNVSR